MNRATIAIPRRWESGLHRIREYLKDDAALASDGIEQYEIIHAEQWDSGMIWVLDDSNLTLNQRLFLRAAIGEINAALNANEGDIWKVAKTLTEERRAEVARIKAMME